MPGVPEWTRLADLPSDGLTLSSGQYGLRHRPVSGIINNHLYAACGYDWLAADGSLTAYKYDIAGDSFSAIRDNSNNLVLCPHEHLYGNGAVVDGKLIAFGGSGTVSYLDIFDPVAETWSTGPTPTIVHATDQNVRYNACCSYSNKLYSFGGWAGRTSSFQSRGLIWNPAAASGSQWSFTSNWNTLSPSVPALISQAIAVYDNKAYLFGGNRLAFPFTTANSYVLIYDFINNSWSRGADMPYASSEEQAGVIGDKIYVTIKGATYIYDPIADLWDATPLVSLFRNSSVSGNNAGYVSDGTNFYVLCGDTNLPTSQYPGYLSNENYHVLQRLAIAVPRGPFVGSIVTV